MKRQSIMDTYKEIKAAYAPRVSEETKKLYFVGVDAVTGVMVVTGAIQGIKGLDDVKDIWARNSNDARSIYNSLR